MSVFHRARTGRKINDPGAIFVHAGAGYHSVQNESVHLQACNDAAVAAMAMLRSGGTAVQAVEMAIKILEDREITNAGYGSNLAIDGVVEGDAIVVDHVGRSGGVGAVAQIKNPISLARTVLDMSTQELSLRRVPPNLLVGQGATDFAFEHGMPVLPHDALVSPAARERWLRWKHDLKNAERKTRQLHESGGLPINPPDDPPGYEDLVRNQMQRNHVQNIQAGVWNEGQPLSPVPSAIRASSGLSIRSQTSSIDTPNSNNTPATPASDNSDAGESDEDHDPLTTRNLANFDRHNDHEMMPADATAISIDDRDIMQINFGAHDGHSMSDEDSSSNSTLRLPSLTPSPPLTAQNTPLPSSHTDIAEALRSPNPSSIASSNDSMDIITDTVGAVAIDNEGNIACGASSGGIGMKYRGRVGPAALVGVGAAVVPVDTEDKSRTCTAVVTSGTGEHMATTLAASVCAERLYHGIRKRRGGGYEHVEDDQAVRAMIEHDFMEHPSVKNSHSSGAIGVLAVKKTSHGAYLYFAHNTDSFALASMHADEPKPTCTMSRSHGNGMVAQGGRAIRYKKKW